MNIIPVIDLLHGQVVRAVAGRRAHYRPQSSPLCADADPAAVLDAMLALHAFTTVYIADLDAILHTGDNARHIGQLLAKFPAQSFWLDAGAIEPTAVHPRLRPVIGSESGVTTVALQEFGSRKADFILSLDFNECGFIGDANILREPQSWPRDVIVMHLPGIGTGRGPALELAKSLAARSNQTRFHLAGGFAILEELRMARAAGMGGALIATLLHERRISSGEIMALELTGI